MAYIDGETLARVRRAGPLPLGDALRFLQEVAWALAYAHGRGVVHRDVKPENILLERATGRAMVTDFGIAQRAGGGAPAGEIIGTAQFVSPEQAQGEPVDARSDLYSLGVSAFFALTGRLPFDAPSLHAFLAQHVTAPLPPWQGCAPVCRRDSPAPWIDAWPRNPWIGFRTARRWPRKWGRFSRRRPPCRR